MNFLEYEIVVLLKDFPDEGLQAGDRGTIVMVYTNPNEAYEVEFVDDNGKTRAQLTLLPHEIKKYR